MKNRLSGLDKKKTTTTPQKEKKIILFFHKNNVRNKITKQTINNKIKLVFQLRKKTAC